MLDWLYDLLGHAVGRIIFWSTVGLPFLLIYLAFKYSSNNEEKLRDKDQNEKKSDPID